MKKLKNQAEHEQRDLLLLDKAALSSMKTTDLILLIGQISNNLIDQALAAEEKQAFHDAARLYGQLKSGLEKVAAYLPDELRIQLLTSADEWGEQAKKMQWQVHLRNIRETQGKPNIYPQKRSSLKQVSEAVVKSTNPSARSYLFRKQRPASTESIAMKNSTLRNINPKKIEFRQLKEWQEDK